MIWNLELFGDRTAVVDEYGCRYSYEQFNQNCHDIANAVGSRCLVFVLCTNTIGSLAGYIGFINARIVPLMLDSHLNSELLENLLETYKPKYVWCPKSFEKKDQMEQCFACYNYVLLKTKFDTYFPLNAELALLLTTSGSTGSPKLVRQSYKNIMSNTKAIIEYLQIDENEKPITTLPMNYTYGLSIINSHLYAGAQIILTDYNIFSREFWQLFKEQNATSFGGVPYTYEMLDKLRFFRMNLPSLTTMTQAGGKLSTDLHQKFAEYAKNNGKRFVVMYGQTEATARMAYLPYQKAIEKCGSMGIPIPGGKFSLIDSEGKEILNPDTVGELVYEGENVTLGYAICGDDLAKGDENFGKLLTGDMAKYDIEGYYYIVGRKKRFLKMFGKRVNLDETERMVKSVFQNCDCACCGIDDNMFVFVTDNSITDDVREFVSEKTNINFSGFKVIYIDSIPKNESGKTLYMELEKYYGR